MPKKSLNCLEKIGRLIKRKGQLIPDVLYYLTARLRNHAIADVAHRDDVAGIALVGFE